uniref:Uncharacterized protein n=1 Tax=Acrobeloides nanus TaxID=290746 RepID=A0A914CST3_9BILA
MYSFEGHSPHEASEVIAVELNLNVDEKKAVFRVLDETDEDPIMVIRLNQNWINTFELAAANQVLDAIATFHMSQGQRRDEQATHLCFRFAEGSHINACRDFLLNDAAYKNAFAPSPTALAHLAAFNINYPENREPMGFCAQVNKIGIRRDDIQTIPFFYL